MIFGGRVIGQGQNASGQATVSVVKSLIMQGLSDRWPVAGYQDGKWLSGLPEVELSLYNRLKFGDRLTVAFPQGGGVPDLVISNDGLIIAVAEIKGRKDKSNLFESWMPTINEHMRTWRTAHPDASKLFFGTVITEELVSGKSKQGAQRVGLKELHDEGLLHALYNVSRIVDREPVAVRVFGQLLEQLDTILRS